jgi:hypothetical protein
MFAKRTVLASLRVAGLGGLMALVCIAYGQNARMWPAADAQAIELPPATARRRLVGDAFMEEVMEPAANSNQTGFTRVAYFSFNPVNQQYEYFSMDSRAPQMMGYVAPGSNKVREGRVELAGSSFVAAEWGNRKNVPFLYRLTVHPVEGDRQRVQLFLTEQVAQGNF